ncbi:hypothetical protein JCM3770_007478 [Rhodotorula araucariae]
MHARVFKSTAARGTAGLVGLRSRDAIGPLYGDHSTVGVASDNEDEWDHAEDDSPASSSRHYFEEDDLYKITRHDLMRKLPARLVRDEFGRLADESSVTSLREDQDRRIRSAIERESIPRFKRWFLHTESATQLADDDLSVTDILEAFLYWTSDSGRLQPIARQGYNDWAVRQKEESVPRLRTQEKGHTEAIPLTWGEVVDVLEWYRTSKLPDFVYFVKGGTQVNQAYPEAASSRFRLDDPLDPIDAFLLVRVFEATLNRIQERSSPASIKKKLDASWQDVYQAFLHTLNEDAHATAAPPSHDDGIDDTRTCPAALCNRSPDSSSPVLELYFPPSSTALYRAFLFYAQGPPPTQRERRHLVPGQADVVWMSHCRDVFRLGTTAATALVGDRAREKSAWMGMSWREWKRRVTTAEIL